MTPQPASGGRDPGHNPLVSTGGSSELQVILHPLVLLSISDYIARHTLQEKKGPLVGGILGQQNGREITIEHAFDVSMTYDASRGKHEVHAGHFSTRLEQMRLVHKDRQLDLVGWYTLLPSKGPDETILDVHRFFLGNYNESAILLGFHPDQVLKHSAGGQLPLTVYESNWEVEGGAKPDQDAEDKRMDDGESGLQLRFRELNYSVETEETEMISMNYVAAGGASAAAATTKEDKPSRSIETNGKGKRRLVESEAEEKGNADTTSVEDDVLTGEEEEMIATLTTKANAIKMLRSRIQLIITYLKQLPPSFINGEKPEDENMDADKAGPSLTVLRQIQALASRLDLVVPSNRDAFEKEVLQETNDVHLIDLLNSVMQGSDQAREVGKKFAVIESSKQSWRTGHDFQPPPSLNMLGSSAGDVMLK